MWFVAVSIVLDMWFVAVSIVLDMWFFAVSIVLEMWFVAVSIVLDMWFVAVSIVLDMWFVAVSIVLDMWFVAVRVVPTLVRGAGKAVGGLTAPLYSTQNPFIIPEFILSSLMTDSLGRLKINTSEVECRHKGRITGIGNWGGGGQCREMKGR
jgi:hypothetical protein